MNMRQSKMPILGTTGSGQKYQRISKGRCDIASFEKNPNLIWFLFSIFIGILSTLGNGYVIFMSSKRKKKLRPAEIMTVNLAVCDLGISGKFMSYFHSFLLSHYSFWKQQDTVLWKS